VPITYPSSLVPVNPLPYHIGSTDQRRIDSTNAINEALRGTNPALATNPLMSMDAASVTYRDFARVHSDHAHEWLSSRPNGTHTFATEGLTFVASTQTRRVYSVQGLQIGTISAMPLADQERIAETAAFNGPGGIGEQLGYLPAPPHNDPADPVNAARSHLDALVTAFLDSEVTNARSADGRTVNLPDDVRQLFEDQAQNIRTRLGTSAIFNPDALSNELSELKRRVNRISEFYLDAGPHLSTSPLTQPPGLSIDIPSIVNSYNAFVDAERRIRNADNRITQLTTLASIGVPTLDLPTLIVRFQSLYEDMAKARSEADTAEVQSLNQLLRDYGEMQRMINEVSGSMDPNEPKERAPFNVVGDERVKLMFTRRTGFELHPLERLGGSGGNPKITRPTFEIVDLAFTGWRHQYFDGRTPEELAHPDFVAYLNELGMNTLPPAFQPGGELYIRRSGLTYYSDWAHDIRARIEDNKDDEGWRLRVSQQLGLTFTMSEGEFNDLRNHYNRGGRAGLNNSILNSLGTTETALSNGMSQLWVDFMFDRNWVGNNRSDFMPVNFEEYYEDFELKRNTWNELDYNEDRNDPGSFYHVARLFKSQWDSFNTRLSDTVTLLNQDNQIRQNRISQENSQANRHFEQVSNTLRRMFDLMQTIGRSTA